MVATVRLLLLALLSALAITPIAKAEAVKTAFVKAATPPNAVIIVADDLGYADTGFRVSDIKASSSSEDVR